MTTPVASPTRLNLLGMPFPTVRICIAEDNPINSRIVLSFVQRMGFVHAFVYADGRKAVDAMEEAYDAGTPFHMVLMDIQMPVMDGYSATRAIRSSPRIGNAIVIAVTASTIKGDREKCFEAGMDAYLAKPIRPRTLRAVLEEFLVVAAPTPPPPPPGGGGGSSSGVSPGASLGSSSVPSPTGGLDLGL